MEDWEKGGVAVTTQMVGFNQVGDFIKGTYTGKKYVASKEVNLYEIKGQLGQYHKTDENKAVIADPVLVEAGLFYQVWGGKTAIDDLFNKAKFGEIVAIKFDSALPSKTKGNSPFKVFKTLQFGPDKDYAGEDSNVQAAFPGSEEVPVTQI